MTLAILICVVVLLVYAIVTDLRNERFRPAFVNMIDAQNSEMKEQLTTLSEKLSRLEEQSGYLLVRTEDLIGTEDLEDALKEAVGRTEGPKA